MTIIPPHRNIGCVGFVLDNGRYLFDLSFPPYENGFRWTWGSLLRLVRIYWKSADGSRNYLYLPGLDYYSPDARRRFRSIRVFNL